MHPLKGAAIAAMSWTVGYLTTMLLADGLVAAAAYALLVGWWLTAYASSTLGLPVLSAAPLAGGYFLLFLVLALNGISPFYKDLETLPLSEMVLVGFVQAAIVASPILFDHLARRLAQRVGSLLK